MNVRPGESIIPQRSHEQRIWEQGVGPDGHWDRFDACLLSRDSMQGCGVAVGRWEHRVLRQQRVQTATQRQYCTHQNASLNSKRGAGGGVCMQNNQCCVVPHTHLHCDYTTPAAGRTAWRLPQRVVQCAAGTWSHLSPGQAMSAVHLPGGTAAPYRLRYKCTYTTSST